MNKNTSCRYWVYFFPAMMDVSVVGLGFFTTMKALSLGAGPVLLGMIGTVWGIGYSLTSLVLTRMARETRAFSFIVTSCVFTVLVGVATALVKSVALLIFLSWWAGFWCAFFFVGFQLSMAKLALLPPEKAVAAYNFSWSLGLAFGAVMEGMLISQTEAVALSPVIIGPLFIIGGLSLVQKTGKGQKLTDSQKEERSEGRNGPFVVIGWMGLASVAVVGTAFRYLLPEIVIHRLQMDSRVTGFYLFLFFLLQSVAGFLLYRRSRWQYRFWHHPLAGLVGFFGCLSFLITSNITGFVAFIVLLGLYSGYGFYYGVLYSLKSPLRTRHISTNEAIVGTSSIVGPFILGVALKKELYEFFQVCAIIIMMAGLLQVWFWLRRRGGKNDCGIETGLQ